MDSLTLIISRSLSYIAIVICVFMKLPQVMALLKSRNTKGIDVRSYWMELSACLIGFSYGFSHEYHVSIYLDALLIAIQDAIIIFVVIYIDKKWTIGNGFCALLEVLFIILTFLKLIPLFIFGVLLSCTLPLGASGKLVQIRTLHQIKSGGSVSLLTWSLDLYVSLSKLFIIYFEVKDMHIFFIMFVTFVLNCVVVIQCLYYPTEKKKI